MGRRTNEENTVGRRLGRLLQQYNLRIAYAKGKRKLYQEEQNNASAKGNSQMALKATIAFKCWEVYETNLTAKREELIEAIQNALIGYNDRQRKIWFAYFIEGKSSYEIADSVVPLNPRLVQRAIAAMKSDMELKFEQKLPEVGEKVAPKWSASDLANYLSDKPAEAYVSAVKDLLDYGIVDLDALEFDKTFQDYLGGNDDGE